MDFTERKKIPAYFREVKIGNRETGGRGTWLTDEKTTLSSMLEGVLKCHGVSREPERRGASRCLEPCFPSPRRTESCFSGDSRTPFPDSTLPTYRTLAKSLSLSTLDLAHF